MFLIDSLYNGIMGVGRGGVCSSPNPVTPGFCSLPGSSPHPPAPWRWPAFAGTTIPGPLGTFYFLIIIDPKLRNKLSFHLRKFWLFLVQKILLLGNVDI